MTYIRDLSRYTVTALFHRCWWCVPPAAPDHADCLSLCLPSAAPRTRSSHCLHRPCVRHTSTDPARVHLRLRGLCASRLLEPSQLRATLCPGARDGPLESVLPPSRVSSASLLMPRMIAPTPPAPSPPRHTGRMPEPKGAWDNSGTVCGYAKVLRVWSYVFG